MGFGPCGSVELPNGKEPGLQFVWEHPDREVPGAKLLSRLRVNRVGTKIVNVCSGQRAERNLRREALICVGVALDKRGARAQSR